MHGSSSIDDDLRQAMIAHRAGRLVEAESGYRDVLSRRPADARALHFLGLLRFHRGERESGIEHITRSLERDPSSARAWNALGGMFIAVARLAEAKQAYRKSTELAPHVAEGWYNLGICLRNEGDVEGSIAMLREAIERDALYFRAYEALAMLLYQLGRIPEAAKVYTDWSMHEPASAKATHMAAAMSGQNAPTRASDTYVRQLFDDAAGKFDANLERLAYRAPQMVAAALNERAQQTQLPTVLDAGCGTGLCGPLIRARCRHLVGVDLSPKMIERAGERDCYDELVVSELTAFLHWRPRAFDAVISADTLVYFGPLEHAFAVAHESLRDEGWLIFTLEALDPVTTDDYRLEVHGRYAHSEAYVRRALASAGFTVDSLAHDTLRQERERDVYGYLVIARRDSSVQVGG
jgi:predicted TPR repeat methyltransferase